VFVCLSVCLSFFFSLSLSHSLCLSISVFTGYTCATGVCVGASVMTIMLLSIDRYVAVRHPVKSRNFSSTGVVIATALGATWVVAGVIMAPLLAMRSVVGVTPLASGEQLDICREVISLPEVPRTLYEHSNDI